MGVVCLIYLLQCAQQPDMTMFKMFLIMSVLNIILIFDRHTSILIIIPPLFQYTAPLFYPSCLHFQISPDTAPPDPTIFTVHGLKESYFLWLCFWKVQEESLSVDAPVTVESGLEERVRLSSQGLCGGGSQLDKNGSTVILKYFAGVTRG